MSWKDNFPTENVYFTTKNGILYNGNCLEVLKQFPDESVDCVITSPPYWSLRDYGEETVVRWEDGTVCQLGLEPDFNLFVQHLLEIFKEVRRVLKPTGTLWVNVSDTYGGSGMGTSSGLNRYFSKENYRPRGSETNSSKLRKTKYNKSLLLIPERFAIGMVERGWKLRNKIIWKKTNSIPESVKDRFTKSYEYIYFFVKSENYYFNQILEPAESSSTARYKRYKRALKEKKFSSLPKSLNPVSGIESYRRKAGERLLFRNKRDVWEFATAQFSAKKLGVEGVEHFAVFPEELPKTCMEAGCPESGIVLDIFAGSGTTLAVAEKLDRKWIGIEVNPEYCQIIKKRVEREVLPLFELSVR